MCAPTAGWKKSLNELLETNEEIKKQKLLAYLVWDTNVLTERKNILDTLGQAANIMGPQHNRQESLHSSGAVTDLMANINSIWWSC